MKLEGIGIVMLGVADLPRSLAFYCGCLGLSVKNQAPGFAFLEAGAVTLGLSEPLAKAASQVPGAVEVVFPVSHVREAYQSLREAGVPFSNAPRNVTSEFWVANLTDPDGHQLSIFGPE
jgi:catechol 2,3-dioxygenase-like lactoylglutathione lyase family enzyme